MSLINNIFSERLIDSIGWTLFHSLWQGVIVTMVFALLIIIMRKYSSQTKYVIGIMSLVLVIFISLLTFTKYYNSTNNMFKSDKIQSTNSEALIAEKTMSPLIKDTKMDKKYKHHQS